MGTRGEMEAQIGDLRDKAGQLLTAFDRCDEEQKEKGRPDGFIMLKERRVSSRFQEERAQRED